MAEPQETADELDVDDEDIDLSEYPADHPEAVDELIRSGGAEVQDSVEERTLREDHRSDLREQDVPAGDLIDPDSNDPADLSLDETKDLVADPGDDRGDSPLSAEEEAMHVVDEP